MQQQPLRLPWLVTIEPTSSPVQHLLPNVPASLALIAPERLEQLLEKSDQLALTIADSNVFRCEAWPSFKAIVISSRVVELAWAFSYAYWEIYRVAFAGRQLDGGIVDLHAFAALGSALHLLRWAHGSLVGAHEEPWPKGCPRPAALPVTDSPEQVADELSLCSIAMYLHHELAHTYVPRVPELGAFEEEQFCDMAAADWILSGATLSEDVLQKRALGVSVGMLMLTARGLAHGNRPDGVHPAGYERLVEVLSSRVPEGQEAVWGMVVGMLALHISDVGLPAHNVPYDRFRDAALGYCEHIHNHGLARDAV